MRKVILLVVFCFTVINVNAQTSKELAGKWQLVKLTKNGSDIALKQQFKTDQVFQIFKDDGKFEGVNGDKTVKGKWKLSEDNKILTVTVNGTDVNFSVDYFDIKKRIITHEQLGTLEYNKISN